MISAIAPGKIILFGEHAVVYGRPALAVPVTQVSVTASVIPLAGDDIRVEAPGIGLHANLSNLPYFKPVVVFIFCVFTTIIFRFSRCFIFFT